MEMTLLLRSRQYWSEDEILEKVSEKYSLQTTKRNTAVGTKESIASYTNRFLSGLKKCMRVMTPCCWKYILISRSGVLKRLPVCQFFLCRELSTSLENLASGSGYYCSSWNSEWIKWRNSFHVLVQLRPEIWDNSSNNCSKHDGMESHFHDRRGMRISSKWIWPNKYVE